MPFDQAATAKALARAAADERAGIDRLCDWLRMPSVGTDPAFDADTRRAGEWCRDHLKASGFDAELIETAPPAGRGQPAVFAHTPGDDDYNGPHVLFYGHYDVQPADPIDLWDSPPFEPVIKPAENGIGERIVARGACDDKGQVAMFLEAMRAWHAETGKAAGGVKMTVLIEGEEESGSANLERLLETEKARFEPCDVCVISDTGMLARGKPAITYGVRGLAYFEIKLIGPDQDLHSGLWGGRVPNPINELAKVIAKLHDDNRRVTIPGFYEGVNGPTQAELDEWAKLGIDPAEQLATIGLTTEGDVGEANQTHVARSWARPTCDVNGIIAGYTGEGAKTVIPSHASAKISFRLVDDQNPEKIKDLFFKWLEDNRPAGSKWDLHDHGGGHAATTPLESDTISAASRAIENACGQPPAMIKSGGSIPVAGLLKANLGLDDDRVHSPNEKFELDCYRAGLKSHVALIGELWTIG